MSLGGLVAYGDSDDSDEENTDNLQNGELPNAETKSDTNTDTVGTVSVVAQSAARPGEDANVKEDKLASNSGFIGSVDDIEDDEPMTSQTLMTSQTPFNVLKLPPPKHSDSGKGGETFQPSLLPTKTSPETTLTPQNILDEADDSTENTTLLLAGLPMPKAEGPKPMSLEMEEDEIEEEIKKKTLQLKTKAEAPPPKRVKRQPVKITIPELPQYDSDDEEDAPTKKKRKPEASTGRTGLFSLLPNPKNVSVKSTNRPLIPHTLTKKPTSKPKPISKPKPAAAAPRPLVSGVPEEDSEEEEDADQSETSNFFSLGSAAGPAPLVMAPDVEEPVKPPEPALTGPWQRHSDVMSDVSRVDMTSQQQSCTAGPSVPVSEGAVGVDAGAENTGPYQGYTPYPSYTQPEPEQSEVQQFLQDEEFLKLAGRRKRGREMIDFIDVQADHQTTPEELTKHLTEEVVPGYSYSKKGKDMPSSQQKRKHQITYLAHQAKEREMELKNQWANNRATKKQTQAKYGF